MQNLRGLISRYMTIVTTAIVFVIICVAFFVQMLDAQQKARTDADTMLVQIESALKRNQRELEEVEAEYRQTCLSNTRAIAYMIQHYPEALESVDELKKIAAFMEVDEIHIFDEKGSIIMGTHPEYWGYTFDSGEQINFFKPMLVDKSLQLVQEIMPNTAQNKQMQYSARWSEDGQFIVQVGMEPTRVAKITNENELSNIFALLKVNEGVDYYAVDAITSQVVGSTRPELLGKNVADIGLKMSEIKRDKDGFHDRINGESAFVVFKRVGDNWIGRSITAKELYGNVSWNILGLAACCILMAVVQVALITRYLNNCVVDGIHEVNKKLKAISDGKLTENVRVRKSQEFVELSQYINDMVRSLMAGNRRLTYVLSKSHMQIGTYEFNDLTKRVFVTDQVAHILELNEEEMEILVTDKNEFKTYVNYLRRYLFDEEENVYYYKRYNEKYIRLEELYENAKTFGIIIDVTDEILKRKQIEQERDVDLLTGLYNRRGLESQLEKLFMNPENLGYGAIIMIDADGLKGINDKYGHEEGDSYIRKIGNIIKGFGMNESIASRQGGDEFVLVLYDYSSEEEVLNTIETLRYIQNNSTANLGNGQDIPLQFSFGYTTFMNRSDYMEMMKEADEKMYSNKRKRKEKK